MSRIFESICLLFVSLGFAAPVLKEDKHAVAKTIMDGFDTNKDGKITIAEIEEHVAGKASRQKWKESFKKVDANKDESLTVDELTNLLEQSSNQEQEKIVDDSEDSIAEALMDGFDTDKDGKLSMQEMLEHIGDNHQLHAHFSDWKTGFKSADADHDDHLTVHELAHMLKNTLSQQEQHKLIQESEGSIAVSIMDGMDTDKDGKLSLVEMVEHLGKDKQVQAAFSGWETGFREADADNDKHLTVEELASLISHLGRQRQQTLVHESERSIGHHILTGFDTDKDGKISMKELVDHVGDSKNVDASFQGWQAGFQEADVDHDGYLTATELTNLIAHVSRQEQQKMVGESEKSIAESMMDGMDADKDGQLSAKELMDHVGDQKKVQAAFTGWESGFKQADANHDGHLNLQELASLLSHVSDHTQKNIAEKTWTEKISKLIGAYDTDKDGKVSLQEMKSYMEKPSPLQGAFEGWEDDFKEADANKDQHLSVDEFQMFVSHSSKSFTRALVSESDDSVIKQFLTAFDENKDGKVSLAELMESIGGKTEVKALQDGWKDAFKEADVNRDGHLAMKELGSLLTLVQKHHHRRLKDESEATAASVMSSFDTDKDGKLGYSEIKGKTAGPTIAGFPGWQMGFLEADADKNGHITAKELASWFKHLTRPRHDEM